MHATIEHYRPNETPTINTIRHSKTTMKPSEGKHKPEEHKDQPKKNPL